MAASGPAAAQATTELNLWVMSTTEAQQQDMRELLKPWLATRPDLRVNATVLNSEIGNVLAQRMADETGTGNGRAAIWCYDETRERFYVSCRGVGNVDVTETAKLFGGGGHRLAAGFECTKLPWH